ncbi:MAG: butyrate kinase [Synergistaceae bacterium]|jgi:butyrate kinase|nr:butyrate kinase [Synergistaceae bacterium]
MGFKVLSLYPKVASTKMALFDGRDMLNSCEARHDLFELSEAPTMRDKSELRLRDLEGPLGEWLQGIRLDAVSGGAVLPPNMPAGVYRIDGEFMARMGRMHGIGRVINHGALLASAISRSRSASGIALVPFSSGEFVEIAKVSGVPGLRFGRMTHTLHLKNAVRLASIDLNRPQEELSLVVAYLGSNFSFCSHSGGRIIDLSNPFERGPFSQTHGGSIPASEIIRMAYSGMWAKTDLLGHVNARGGLMSYFGTNDLCKAISMMEEGDAYASLVVHAMAYQVAEELASLATTLCGKVDAIALIGMCAVKRPFAKLIREGASWISPTMLTYCGEDELVTFADAALSALSGESAPLVCGNFPII